MAKSEKKTGLHYVLKMPQLKVITKNGTFFTEKQSQGLFSDAGFSLFYVTESEVKNLLTLE